jgi:phosphoglycerate kinase
MAIKRVDELDLAGKRVFCRVDFNVPLNSAGEVTDDTRVQAALPTLMHVLKAGGKLICASHLGRPKGKVNDKLRLEPVGAVLARLLGGDYQVLAVDESAGDGARKVIQDMTDRDIVLLENLRFNPGETKNEEGFAKALAKLADVYVNDAFGTAHRAHASTAGMVPHVAEKAAGFLMMKEVDTLGRLLGEIERPFVAVLGGAKVSDKIEVMESLLGRVNALLVGGAMANTFLKAQGGQLGKSLVEDDKLDLANRILKRADAKGVKVLLPTDVLVAEALDAPAGQLVPANQVPEGQMALDIGPDTRERFAAELAGARNIFWNGPMGVFEQPAFADGTMAVARAVAASEARSVVGGGDSVAAIKRSGIADQIGHISTGGGASLELLEGKTLPGIAALEA